MTSHPTFRYYVATTLDGFIADERDSLDWLVTQPQGENPLLDYDRFIEEVGVLVMGRATYDWVTARDVAEEPLWPYSQPTVVFTHRPLDPVADTITTADGPPSRLRGMLEELAAGKDVWIVGGGDLAAAFAADGMLDTVEVSIAPVTLGAGKPLLGGRFDLRLREQGRNEAFLEARYDVVGPRG